MDFDGDGLAVGLAALGEPFTKSGGESLRIDLQTGFHLAFRDRQGVVKLSRAGEVAHAEGIEPIHRAWLALRADDHIDPQFLRVHAGSIASTAVELCDERRRNTLSVGLLLRAGRRAAANLRADDFARDDDFDAAVLLAAGHRVVAGDWA